MILTMALCLTLSADAPSSSFLENWNRTRVKQNQVSMVILGSWASLNIVLGTTGALLEQDERLKSFYLGNAIWNSVNLGLAVVGLVTAGRTEPAKVDAKQSLDESDSLAKAFLFNAGLDVAYLATSVLLWQRGTFTGEDRLVGFGQALLLQGAFLAVFDGLMFFVVRGEQQKLFKNLQVTPLGIAGAF
jgi:hypothetical protein